MFESWTACLSTFVQDEHGQGLVEYALMLLIVAIAAIAAMTIFGAAVDTLINTVATGF